MAGPDSAFRPGDVRIYRPYPDEIPWELFNGSGSETAIDRGRAADEVPAAETLIAAIDRNYLRVARYQGELVGGYAIRPLDPVSFELLMLVVAAPYRRRGVGRWLLGHAIGLAETKGGREIVTARPGASRARALLEANGFRADPAGLRLVLTPE